MNVLVSIKTGLWRRRVWAYPAPAIWDIVPCAVVIQPTLLVSFLSCETIPLTTVTAETCLAIRKVFFAVDECVTCNSRATDDNAGVTEMIPEVVFHGGIGCAIVREGVTHTHHRDAALVVHNMESIVCCAVAKMVFEGAVLVDRYFDLALLVANEFLHTLARGIVQVTRRDGRGATGCGAVGERH